MTISIKKKGEAAHSKININFETISCFIDAYKNEKNSP